MPVENEVLVLPGAHQPLVLERRLLRDPLPGEALVRIEACGVCGSDLFLRKGGFGTQKFPIVPGHEAAGRVEAVGDPHDRSLVGQQVALYYIDAPADSTWAHAGAVNIGPDVVRMGVDVDGAFAQYVIRPVASLVPVVQAMDPAVVAVCTDALATPYHALVAIAKVRAGERVLVIGPGGVGSNAVQIAVLLGAEVAVVGRSKAKLDQALLLGAQAALTSDHGVEAVRDVVGGNVDVVVECSGDPAMARFAIEVAGFRARVVMVGASTEPFSIWSGDLIWRELSVMGSRGFTPLEISAVLDLVTEGQLNTDHLTADRRSWRDAENALMDLQAGRTTRTVLTMSDD